MPNGKKKNHPCARWCEQQLYGIVENLRLRGEVGEDFHVEFVPMIGIKLVPGDTYLLKCTHGREWMLKEPKPVKA